MTNLLSVESKLQFMYEAYLRTGEFELAAWYWNGLRTVQSQILEPEFDRINHGPFEHPVSNLDGQLNK